MTDTSSDNPLPPVIYLPSEEPLPGFRKDDEYVTSWEQMLADRDAEEQRAALVKKALEKTKLPPLDALGRKRKDDNVSALTGSIDKKTTYCPATDDPYERKVVLFRDTNLEFPELHFRVCVTGPPEDTRGFARMFSRAYCVGTNEPLDADLVVFTGGPDVHPSFYGEQPVASFMGSDARDDYDIVNYLTCLNEGIPMLGICRGAQFLAAMQNFKLVQDLDGHQSDHAMHDVINDVLLDKVSSRHHQAVIPGPGMTVIARAWASTYKELTPTHTITKQPNKGVIWPPDVEAFFIRDTCSIGIQGHPEYGGYYSFAQWALNILDKYIILNEDIGWDQDRRRLKREFILERDLRYNALGMKDPAPKRKIIGINAMTSKGAE